jgi:arginine/lysine/ornithine decarboxylase
MKTIITDTITKYKNHISFHTPAHSGVLNSLDVTELSFSDDLLNPNGVIAKSQNELSRALGVDNSIYLTGGGTSAVHIALFVVKDKTLLVVGSAHKAVFAAIELYNIKAYYCYNLQNAEEAVAKHNIDAVFVTSPNYFGFVKSGQISKRISQKLTLLVDESHGAHFPYSKLLPQSALSYAHIVIQSCHKTLPTLTGSAMLHFKKEFCEKILRAFKLIHSTSPQYPLIISTEQAVAELLINGESYYSEIIAEIENFKLKLPKPFEALQTDDKTRLVISSPYDAAVVATFLEKNNIFLETMYQNMLVFIVTRHNFKNLATLLTVLNKTPNDTRHTMHDARKKTDEIFCLNDNAELMQAGLDNELLFMLL